MKKLVVAVLAALALVAVSDGVATVAVKNHNAARCTWCYSGDCFNSSICGYGCYCVKAGGNVYGTCYSIDRSQVLPEGWEVLP